MLTLTAPTATVQTVFTEDQTELLEELESMDLFRKSSTYRWFMEELADEGIETVSDWEDRYSGCFENGLESGMDNAGAEFAQNLAEECGEIPSDLPSWIDIDWKGSWDNLRFDYNTIEVPAESGHGYIQETFFFHNY